MTSERQFDALLRSWLDASAPSDTPQGLLESIVSTTAHTRPRPAWLVRLGGEPMPQAGRGELNRFAPLALAATALIVALLIGIRVLVGLPNVGPPNPPNSLTPGPSTTPVPTAQTAARWTATGSMIEARSGYTATLLANGKVLVAGGETGTAELYDPSSGSWTATGNMITVQDGHAATLLFDGRVLAAGQGDSTVAELYDPASGTWTATGNMVSNWFTGFTATRLADGRVLVAGAGGSSPDVDPAPPELYDPASGTWSATEEMVTPRSNHTSTLLPDGRVLVAGGGGKGYLASAEVYDPARGTWTATGDMAVVRGNFTASLLPDGSVLVVGGLNHNGGGVEWASAELYDPVSGSWTATGSMGEARYGHAATLLRDGSVLVVAGLNTDLSGINSPLATAELYDPSSGSWTATANLVEARAGATATILSDGRVLVTGGIDINGTPLTTAELYAPGSGS